MISGKNKAHVVDSVKLKNSNKKNTSSPLYNQIEKIIDAGTKDTGRLLHILHTLKDGKSLYKSDQHYLDDCLSSVKKTPSNIPVSSIPYTKNSNKKKYFLHHCIIKLKKLLMLEQKILADFFIFFTH